MAMVKNEILILQNEKYPWQELIRSLFQFQIEHLIDYLIVFYQ